MQSKLHFKPLAGKRSTSLSSRAPNSPHLLTRSALALSRSFYKDPSYSPLSRRHRDSAVHGKYLGQELFPALGN